MRVFFSWQSDLPNNNNRNFIEGALTAAVEKVTTKTDVEPVVDRDVKGQTGAPQIAQSILEKIERSDLFVADVSIVGISNEGKENARPTPNPNVLAEVGYAAGVIGWERVVLIYNAEYGTAESLPFDLRHRLVFGYELDGSEEKKASEKKRLRSILQSQIQGVADATNLPPTLHQLREKAVLDQTIFRVVTPESNLDQLGWEFDDDEEAAEVLVEVNDFATRLKNLPRRTAQFLAVVMRRTNGKPARAFTDDLEEATGLPGDQAAQFVHQLEDANLLVIDRDEDTGRYYVELRGRLPTSGDSFLETLRRFALKQKLFPETLVVDLRFDLLSSESESAVAPKTQ